MLNNWMGWGTRVGSVLKELEEEAGDGSKPKDPNCGAKRWGTSKRGPQEKKGPPARAL